ncbi:hypothetical protein E4188_22435 (plasmid) [Aeromonas media]|uniref:Uncharacterized protein n=1 Tax=Aeromonas media TaxID=651 RepID=A0ABX6NZJ8_AERME|nr:hypothetical protein [Aeromonas media]QJT41259.1 hypothetical protein E4188_22435 [Aeromonas media]
MNANIKVTAQNANTEALLAHLNHLNASALGCFYESAYCVKVPVKNLSEAMMLGMSLGDKYGKITHQNSPQSIVFTDTRCQAR